MKEVYGDCFILVMHVIYQFKNVLLNVICTLNSQVDKWWVESILLGLFRFLLGINNSAIFCTKNTRKKD